MSGVPTCPGYCCEAFSIGSPEEFDARNKDQPEYELVKGLVIHLGQFEGNPTGRTECGKRSTKRLEPGDPSGWHFHTCRAWDPETRLCTVYETRPSMCRKYPNWDVCAFDGCDMGPTLGPHAGKTKTEVLAIREQEAAVARRDRLMQLAAALPQIQPQNMESVVVELSRPARMTTMVYVLVPKGSTPEQIVELAQAGAAGAETSRWRWDSAPLEGGGIEARVVDVEQELEQENRLVDGPITYRKALPGDE